MTAGSEKEQRDKLIRQFLEMGLSYRQISKELGVSNRAISKVKKEMPPEDSEGISQKDVLATTNYSTNDKVLLTSRQKSLLKILKDEKNILFNDKQEGWIYDTTEAQLNAEGNILWFCGIVYPESAPQGWIGTLCRTGLRFGVSLLHDKDKYDHDSPEGDGLKDGKPYHYARGERYKLGNPKKAHWHVFGSLDKPMKFYEFAQKFQEITHGPIPQKCTSLFGYDKYIQHEGIPDKYQYWKEGKPTYYNGFTLELNTSERKKVLKQITNDIRKYRIDDIGELTKKYGESPEWLDIVAARANYINSLLRAQKLRNHPEYTDHARNVKELFSLRQQTKQTLLLESQITGEIPDDERVNEEMKKLENEMKKKDV